jgi:hypothetical protein
MHVLLFFMHHPEDVMLVHVLQYGERCLVPHAGCALSHFTFLVLHLKGVNTIQTNIYVDKHLRFAAHRHRPFPFARRAALATPNSILSARALVAP